MFEEICIFREEFELWRTVPCALVVSILLLLSLNFNLLTDILEGDIVIL